MTPNKNTEIKKKKLYKKIYEILWDTPVAISSYRGKVCSARERNTKQILEAIHSRDMEIIKRIKKEKVKTDGDMFSEGWNCGLDTASEILQEETK